jgi:uncharacterized protein
MRDDEFEWDDRKAAANERKHDVSFELARLAFDDPMSIDDGDPDPVEERYNRLCSFGDSLVVVCYTDRGDRVRIISARKANKHEQYIYQTQ